LASAGLFVASEHVTESAFDRFVQSVGQHAGSLGLAFVSDRDAAGPLVDDIAEPDPGLELFLFDQSGARVPSSSEGTGYPVWYFVPTEGSDLDLRGFDAASDPAWAEVLGRAAEDESVQISRLTQLFGVPGDWGFLAVAPVIPDAQVTGYAVSVVRLEALVEGELAESLAEVVIWDVRDITSGAVAAVSPDPLRRAQTLEVGGRVWRVEVIPTETARRRDLAGSGILPGLSVGVLLSVLAALATHLAVAAWRSRREAEEIWRLTEEKDEFLAAISHELRTPLTTVVGMAEILEESTLGADPEIREYVTLLRQEGKELAQLVEDLLLVGRLDAQVLPMRPEVVDLRWEVAHVVNAIEPSGDVRLSAVGEGKAWADPLRLRHVIRHLYTNALRHGGRTVSIRIEEKGHETLLEVCDDGPGVPQEKLYRMFTAVAGVKATPGGPSTLGLGLRVSKRLAVVLGGDLAYRREGPLTVFELRLPGSETDEVRRRQAFGAGERSRSDAMIRQT
jgi:signal transduction histidine kinase